MKQSDPHRSSFSGKIINNWEQSHWSCTPQTGKIASCHCGTGCVEQEPWCLHRLFPPPGGLSAHSSWIMQSAGFSSAGSPSLLHRTLHLLQRKHLQQGSKGRDSCSKEVGIQKEILKTNLAWGHWWYSNRAGATKVGFLIQTVGLRASDSWLVTRGKNKHLFSLLLGSLPTASTRRLRRPSPTKQVDTTDNRPCYIGPGPRCHKYPLFIWAKSYYILRKKTKRNWEN